MATAILHVGMHKTGSSSIQTSLAALPPGRGPTVMKVRGGNANLSGVLRKGFDRSIQRRYGEDAAMSRMENRQQRCVEELRDLFAAHRDEDIVISAEGFDNLEEQAFADFLAIVPHDDIRVIGYVRPPHSFMESAFNQRLKSGITNMAPGKLIPNYEQVFGKYERHVPTQLRMFDRDALHEGCVVRDFCREAGIHIEDHEVINENAGLTIPAAELMLAFNRWRENAGLPYPRGYLLPPLLRELEGDKIRLSAKFTAPVIARSADDIAWIESRLGRQFAETPSDKGLSRSDTLGGAGDEAMVWLAGKLGKSWDTSVGNETAGLWMQMLYEHASVRYVQRRAVEQDDV